MLKGTKLYSIVGGVCPVCHEESMYREPNPYKLNTIYEMHENCSNCGTKYKIEPSFFYGAMYVSYGLGVAFAIATFMTAHYLIGFNLLNAFVSIIIVLIVLMPIIMRLSRNIWINFFMDYDKSKAKGKSE